MPSPADDAMDRRIFLGTLAAGLIAAPHGASAQPRAAQRVPIVGTLNPGREDLTFPSIATLRRGLRALGRIEGQNIRLEYRWANGKVDALPELAAELVRLNVDVLYTSGPQAMRAAVAASRTVPIVGDNLEDDPVADGLVASIGRPGGNLTGFFLNLPDLTAKWLQLIREVVPGARRVAVLWDATTNRSQLRALTTAARGATVELRVLEVRRSSEYAAVLKASLKERPQALLQLSSPLIRQSAPLIADFSVKNRLPAISMFRLFAESGGMMAYGPDLPAFFSRTASYVDRILKGANPGELPIEHPTTFELLINLKTARALGVKVPAALLQRADQVIE
jgi:putative ABC transport system substrate-binding protein